MSEFQPARPRYTLPFAGQDYELLGTFALIEAAEYAMRANIGDVAVQVVRSMPSFELARLVSVILTHCGHKLPLDDAKRLMWDEVGLSGEANASLRLHLFGFLQICLAPPGEREGKYRESGEYQVKLRAEVAPSPGSDTGKSASASSAGDQATSGQPTPGA